MQVTLAWQRASQTGSLGCCWLAFCEIKSYTKSSQKLQWTIMSKEYSNLCHHVKSSKVAWLLLWWSCKILYFGGGCSVAMYHVPRSLDLRIHNMTLIRMVSLLLFRYCYFWYGTALALLLGVVNLSKCTILFRVEALPERESPVRETFPWMWLILL